MKRSEINQIMRAADSFFRSQGFHLPPFAYWSPHDWTRKGEEVSEIVDRRLEGVATLVVGGLPVTCNLTLPVSCTAKIAMNKANPNGPQFEFEYSNSSENTTEATPALRTTSGNVSLQTFGLPGFQLYFTTGGGIYREKLGTDEETAALLNNGGGIKINIAGPMRARVDYRVLSLKGNPRHSTVQRLYAGLNLAF